MFSFDILTKIAFSPFQKNDFLFDNSDIVNATFNTLTSNFKPCRYFEIDNIPVNKSKPYPLNIIHINICSLQKNFDSLQEFLYLLPNNLDIICLSESRIKQTFLINIDMSTHKLYRDDSPTRAGGVAVYVNNKILAEIMSKLLSNIDGCENI